MGCGQSKIDKIYPRKRKRRGCNKLSAAVDAEADEDVEETDRGGGHHADEDDEEEANKKAAAKIRLLSAGGPLLAHSEISSSQLDFFKMLDDKIENSPDYDPNSEEEVAYERARLSSLIRDWESASCCNTTTSGRLLPTTPGSRKLQPQLSQSPQKQYYHPQFQPNGDLYNQQYHQQFQQPQYPNLRGQFFMPRQQYPRVYPQMSPKNFQSVPIPQSQATSVVQYRKSRGVYTELA